MQTTISSKHMAITPAIEEYAEKKAAKLRRFFNRIQQIDVVIDKTKNGYTVEIITDVEHHEPFIATASDPDLYACIDLGADRAARQLKDHKSRLRDNKHIIPNSHTAVPATALRPGPRRKTTKKKLGRAVRGAAARGKRA